MSIFNALYPQGDFLNIRANAPTQADYNIRAKSYTPSGIMQAIASAPLAERISNLDLIGNFGFGTPAAASEISMREPNDIEDYLGTSTPTEISIPEAPKVFSPTQDYNFLPSAYENETLGEDVKKSIFPLTKENITTGIGTLLDFVTPGSFIPRVGEAIFGPPDPRVKVMRDFYGLQPSDAGTIQSGIMKGYNPVSGGFLNFITGGRYGSPTNYGLQRTYQKRINMIEDLLARGKYRDPLKKIDLLNKLKEGKRREAMALEQPTIDRARAAAPDVYREAERQGFTGPGGGFSTTGREGAFSSKSGVGRQDY